MAAYLQQEGSANDKRRLTYNNEHHCMLLLAEFRRNGGAPHVNNNGDIENKTCSFQDQRVNRLQPSIRSSPLAREDNDANDLT